MNVRLATQVLAALAVFGVVGLSWWAVTPDGAPLGAYGQPEAIAVHVPAVDSEVDEPIAVSIPLQGIGIVRVHTESFEDPAFPSITTSKWSVADRCSIFPGRSDVVGWGRRTCDASHGSASLWAVGGGSFGRDLACNATYPGQISDPRRTCTEVNTLLRYTTFDLTNAACLRVTFDYKAKMPAGALRVAIGDRDDQGNITFRQQYTDFMTDTGAEWQRGVIRNFPDAAFKTRVVLGFFYIDESGTGGYSGATIDNLLVDALRDNCDALPFPSPTVPTEPPPPTEAPTNTPFVFPPTVTKGPPTATPTPPRPPRVAMPLLMRRFDIARATIPYFTAPPPTVTPTPSDTPTEPPPPTETEAPTRTPRPTSTPSVTPRPSATPVPMPNVQIVDIMPFPIDPGTSLEVVTLMNVGTAAQVMDGWRLFNLSRSEVCRFPAGLSIPANGKYEVRAGSDARTNETGVACSSRYIWDNHKDEAQLYNEFNLMVSCYAYDENGPYNCMPGER